MLKITLVFLLFVASTFGQTCDTNLLYACADAYMECTTGATTNDEICECYIAFGNCASCAGECYPQDQIYSMVEGCYSFGCSNCEYFWSCYSNGQNCNYDALNDCNNEYYECASCARDLDEVCECYLDYGSCAPCAGECFGESEIQSMMDACVSSGCGDCDGFWECGGNGDEGGVSSLAISLSLIVGALLF